MNKLFSFLRSLFNNAHGRRASKLGALTRCHSEMNLFIISFHEPYSEHNEKCLKIQYSDWIFFLNVVSLYIIITFVRQLKKIPNEQRQPIIDENLRTAEDAYPSICTELNGLIKFIHSKNEFPSPADADEAVTMWLFLKFFDKGTANEEEYYDLITMCDHIRILLIKAHIDMLELEKFA